MEKVAYYIVHDPVANEEWHLASYDNETLKGAEDDGLVFIAVDDKGNRARVSAADVREPETPSGNVVLVQPQYVDERMDAVIKVFDKLAEFMPMTMSDDSTEDTFAGALDALKAVARGEGDNGNA